MGAILRLKELNIDVHRGGAGPRSCAPVRASFKPGLIGRLCGSARSWTDPAVIEYFQFSHPLAIGTNPYTFEKCHRQTCSRVAVSCWQTKWSYAGINSQPWPQLASLKVSAI